MKRLTLLDRVLLVGLTMIWLTAFALHLKEVATGNLSWVGVFVSVPTDSERYPLVRGFWPGLNGEASGLLPGDRLVRVGEVGLEGVGPVGFVARVERAANADSVAPIFYERNGVLREAGLKLAAAAYPWRIVPFVAVLVLTGVIVLLRVPGAPIGRAFFLAAMAYATQWTFFPGGPLGQTYAWAVLFAVASLVALPLSLRAALIFPSETAPRGGLPYWPWMFSAFGPAAFSWVFGTPLPPPYGQQAAFAINVLFILTFLGLITRNFWRAGPVGRRRLKWALVGTYVGLAPLLTMDAVAALEPSLSWLHDAAAVSLVAIPLGLLIGIVSFNLFDVDRVIATTAVYSILSFVVVAATLTLVPTISRAGAAVVGVDAGTSTVVLSVLLAGGIVPAQRVLRPHVEHTFFNESYALRLEIETLLRDLTCHEDAGSLIRHTRDRLGSLLSAETCIAYLLEDSSYTAHPRVAALPAFDADSPVIRALRASAGPLDAQGQRRARLGPRLDARIADVLAELGFAVMLPVRRGDVLIGFIALGAKRSGDVYTETDLALLGILTSHLSHELMRAEVQRYAPRQVLEALRKDPLALAPRAQSVTILFSDMRGSTSIAESMAAADWLKLQDEYFDTMMTVIRQNHGVLVKTIGDAVMAVWNAPAPIDDHSARGCRAALEMLAALRALNLAWTAIGWPAIDIRIGMHAGETMVGNFGTPDLLEYDARGDAVNLASRLEGLNKVYGTRALVSESIRQQLDVDFIYRELDVVRVVGRVQPVVVTELLGLNSGSASVELHRLKERFAVALAAYRARAWDEAIAAFEDVAREFPDDAPTRHYVERCRGFRSQPPLQDWDGVFDARSK